MRTNRQLRYGISFMILAVLLIIFMIINIKYGSTDIKTKDILMALLGRDSTSASARIIMDIRMPRVIAALILGGALSVSGYLLQTFFGNPIAGPFVLGISSGAKLTVSIAMIFFLGHGIVVSSATLILSAFAGAMLSTGFILSVSGRVKKMSVLVVCGVMTGYICSAVTDFIITFADDSNIVNLHNWSMGSFSGISWENVEIMTIIIFITLIVTFAMSKPISAYQLGEVYAKNMGINIKKFRVMLILTSSVLSAVVTAFAGPISFVGIAVPHLVKRMFNTSKPLIIIPACFMGGAVFCMLCDLIARTLFAPTEMSISSITAVFGAPIVIKMMINRREEQHG